MAMIKAASLASKADGPIEEKSELFSPIEESESLKTLLKVLHSAFRTTSLRDQRCSEVPRRCPNKSSLEAAPEIETEICESDPEKGG